MQCASVKNKASTERCSAKALKNLKFCGKHAKMKVPKLWVDTDDRSIAACRIQKIWKGYRVRYRMILQGPGILSRVKCHNEEDLVSCEERNKIHPGNYFSFEEEGKLYWFDFRTIYAWSLERLKPTNPYTRKELTIETRKRLKEIAYLRSKTALCLFHDLSRSSEYQKVFQDHWTLIGQYIEENLFEEINLGILLNLNRTQFWVFSSYMCESLLVWASEKKSSRRDLYYTWMRYCLRRQTLEIGGNTDVAYYVGNTLLKILRDCKQPYEVCFQIMGARLRL
jgi:hypothetical protein